MAPVFEGSKTSKFDAKGRMAFPASFRNRLDEDHGGAIVVTIASEGCLVVYSPDEWKAKRAELEAEGRSPKIAMFCTGGIRCEKSTAFARAEGVEDVFHLKGGILNYLEHVPEDESLWRGECFVFDERVSVGHGLVPGDHGLCRACRRPLDRDDMAHAHYVEGVSCPRCYPERSDEQRARYAERHRQAELARSRGEDHIGRREEPTTDG